MVDLTVSTVPVGWSSTSPTAAKKNVLVAHYARRFALTELSFGPVYMVESLCRSSLEAVPLDMNVRSRLCGHCAKIFASRPGPVVSTVSMSFQSAKRPGLWDRDMLVAHTEWATARLRVEYLTRGNPATVSNATVSPFGFLAWKAVEGECPMWV